MLSNYSFVIMVAMQKSIAVLTNFWSKSKAHLCILSIAVLTNFWSKSRAHLCILKPLSSLSRGTGTHVMQVSDVPSWAHWTNLVRDMEGGILWRAWQVFWLCQRQQQCWPSSFPFLPFPGRQELCSLSTSPNIFDAFASKLYMTLWCQDNCGAKLFCYMLKHPLFVKEVMAQSHDIGKACAQVNVSTRHPSFLPWCTSWDLLYQLAPALPDRTWSNPFALPCHLTLFLAVLCLIGMLLLLQIATNLLAFFFYVYSFCCLICH